MAVLKNRAKMSTSTTGTGTITLGSAEDGYQTFADAGVANADVVRYVIEDGSNWEIGTGTYTATGTTLSRTVSESSNSDAAINLSGSATVFIGATAEDIPETNLYAENYDGSSTKPVASGTNAVSIGRNAEATASNSIALGFDAVASASLSFAALDGTATGVGSIAIGEAAVAGTSSSSIAIGRNTDATGTDAMALGSNAQSTGSESVSIGQSFASGNSSFAAVIDNNTSTYGATGANSVAIGQLAKATQANSIAIGDTATSTTANQIALGGTTDTVKISGTYTLPTTDGTNGQVLTTSGSGAVTFADAGGGGGSPDLFAESYDGSSTKPSASGSQNAVSIGVSANASGHDTISIGENSSAASSKALALGYGAYAGGGGQNTAIGPSSFTGTSAYSSAFGHNAYSTGQDGVAIGQARSTGTDSFAAAISTNSSSYGASGANSIAMGRQSKAGNINSVSIGSFASATGDSSYALGYQATAESFNSVCIGANSKSDRTGKIAFAAGIFAVTGDAQGGQFILRRLTTDATPKTLSTTGGNGGASNQIVANSDTAITFDGTITALQDGAQAYASWRIEGLLVNDGGTTTLANSATTVIQNSSGWGMALSADNTNNALAITCTGEAAHNIRWVANIRTTEVTYA